MKQNRREFTYLKSKRYGDVEAMFDSNQREAIEATMRIWNKREYNPEVMTVVEIKEGEQVYDKEAVSKLVEALERIAAQSTFDPSDTQDLERGDLLDIVIDDTIKARQALEKWNEK